MSFWDEEAGYDIRDPKHPDRANAAQGLKELVRATPPRRYACPECGQDFAGMVLRDLHVDSEHGSEEV